MKRRIKAIILLICVMVASVILASCASNNKFSEYEKQGYTVKVTFDGNGAALLTKVGNKLVDLYNPSNYTADENGEVHIKIIDPEKRGLTDAITGFLTMPNFTHFGWYKSRVAKLNENNEMVDDLGNVLEFNENNDKYYIKGTDTESFPLYEYSEPFNFETDTITAKVGEPVEVTLYAGWVRYFEFEFYHVNDGKVELYATQSFDYKVAKGLDGTTASAKDEIYLPAYKDGAMNYSYQNSAGEQYEFPNVPMRTFDKAYLDEDCLQEITTASFKHQGTFDEESCVATNRVQKIYVTTLPGHIYKVDKPEVLVNNPDPYGIYEIYNDLDFTGLEWPMELTQAEFYGELKSQTGAPVKLSNIEARFAHASATSAGLFGAIGENAKLENISFENVTLTITSVPADAKNMTVGTLFGNVSDKAVLTNITLTNATLVLQNVSIKTDVESNNQVNLLGNGNIQGVTVTDTLHLHLKGIKRGSYYRFMLDPTKATVNAENYVSLVVASYRSPDTEIFKIQ